MSDSPVVIYHNPYCSKSRATLVLLRENGIEPQIIEYLVNPPDAAELKNILDMLGIKAHELLRKGEADYKQLNLSDPALGQDAIIEAMLEHPRLIERPVVVNNGRAAVGRPPELVLEII